MSLRPDRLRGFAQRSRDVVVAAAVVGVVTGLRRGRLRAAHRRPPRLGPRLARLARGRRARRRARRSPHSPCATSPSGRRPGSPTRGSRRSTTRTTTWTSRTGPGGVLASMLTIGFGGAMGLEGLSIFAGGTIGTFVQQRMRWLFRPGRPQGADDGGRRGRRRRDLQGAGHRRAVRDRGAVRRRLRAPQAAPCLVAAATGYLGFAAINGTEPLFAVHRARRLRRDEHRRRARARPRRRTRRAGLRVDARRRRSASSRRVALPTRIVGADDRVRRPAARRARRAPAAT